MASIELDDSKMKGFLYLLIHDVRHDFNYNRLKNYIDILNVSLANKFQDMEITWSGGKEKVYKKSNQVKFNDKYYNIYNEIKLFINNYGDIKKFFFENLFFSFGYLNNGINTENLLSRIKLAYKKTLYNANLEYNISDNDSKIFKDSEMYFNIQYDVLELLLSENKNDYNTISNIISSDRYYYLVIIIFYLYSYSDIYNTLDTDKLHNIMNYHPDWVIIFKILKKKQIGGMVSDGSLQEMEIVTDLEQALADSQQDSNKSVFFEFVDIDRNMTLTPEEIPDDVIDITEIELIALIDNFDKVILELEQENKTFEDLITLFKTALILGESPDDLSTSNTDIEVAVPDFDPNELIKINENKIEKIKKIKKEKNLVPQQNTRTSTRIRYNTKTAEEIMKSAGVLEQEKREEEQFDARSAASKKAWLEKLNSEIADDDKTKITDPNKDRNIKFVNTILHYTTTTLLNKVNELLPNNGDNDKLKNFIIREGENLNKKLLDKVTPINPAGDDNLLNNVKDNFKSSNIKNNESLIDNITVKDKRFIINNAVTILPNELKDLQFCPLSSIIDPAPVMFGSCDGINKKTRGFEKGDMKVNIINNEKNIKYFTEIRYNDDTKVANINVKLELSTVPSFNYEYNTPSEDINSTTRNLSVANTYQALCNTLIDGLKEQKGAFLDLMKSNPDLIKKIIGLILRKSLGDMWQEFNGILKNGGYINVPSYDNPSNDQKSIEEFTSTNRDANRCVLSNDRPSGARIIYYKLFFPADEINQNGCGGYYHNSDNNFFITSPQSGGGLKLKRKKTKKYKKKPKKSIRNKKKSKKTKKNKKIFKKTRKHKRKI